MTIEEVKTIENSVADVIDRVAAASSAAGKKPEDIHLVAASKMNSAERVQVAIQAGIRICGENRVQELLEKYEQNAYAGADLHFIGTLQTNKVKYLIGKVSLIHSVSSLKLLQTINKEAARQKICQDVLLEINIGREAAKSGFSPEELPDVLQSVSQLDSVRVLGLMAIPPIPLEPHGNSRYFREMQQLFVDISLKKYDNVNMAYLSMGMSHDFEDAFACGANMVRVGTGIFGARHYATADSVK